MPSLSTVTCYGRLIFHANSFHLPRDSFPKNEISSCDYGGRNDGYITMVTEFPSLYTLS
uniref:Uncharacterized protein n=1 Tax=Physcomitrium patens TaxID=3218 RepID=A0A2K1KNY2_PHYPA|nr:hypothetical protein PHYPA_006374 [Physcomitrium patens]